MASRSSIGYAVIVLLGASEAMVWAPAESNAQTVTVGDVHRAWQARQERLASARFKWVEQELVSPVVGENRGKMESQRETEALLYLKGPKVRYEREIVSFVKGDTGEPQKMVTAFDGNLNQSFLPAENSESGSGTIGEGQASNDAGGVQIQAIMAAVRPLVLEREILYPAGSGLSPRYRLHRPSLRVDGREVLAIETSIVGGSEFASGSMKRTVYIDPQRSFLPLRCTEEVGGVLAVQVDVEYEEDEHAGWVPVAWNASMFDGNGRITEATKGRVTEYSINEDLSDDLFRIKYPAGTVVTDMRRGERELVMSTDGTLKPAILVETALPPRNWWIMMGATSAIVLVLFWYWYKQRIAATST